MLYKDFKIVQPFCIDAPLSSDFRAFICHRIFHIIVICGFLYVSCVGLQALNGFLFVVSSQGKVEFVSENVSQFLKFTQVCHTF